jgi:serine protease Do
MPTPAGTGFFISPDGWFLTAAHVVFDRETQAVRTDISSAWLMKEGRPPNFWSSMCQHPELVEFLPEIDVALLRVDWEKNKEKKWLKSRSAFPYIKPSAAELEEGEAVYAFGYPLSDGTIHRQDEQVTMGSSSLRPRVTSAIVSSTLEQTAVFMTGAEPKVYVLDKALNYGNSGGPIVSVETGYVHALCSRFQPVFVPQPQLKNADGTMPFIMVPSLYGVVTRLDNPSLLEVLKKHAIAYET